MTFFEHKSILDAALERARICREHKEWEDLERYLETATHEARQLFLLSAPLNERLEPCKDGERVTVWPNIIPTSTVRGELPE